MPDYFLSDVHLRQDRPERALRLARFVDGLGGEDRLFVVGDLCDFWMATRELRREASHCPGLRSLAGYSARGGRLTVLAGNHDVWMGDYYRRTLAATWVPGELSVASHGLRVHLAHGHRLGARSLWKAGMEGRAFFRAFGLAPSFLASRLESRLERSNEAHREADERRHLELYRRFADTMEGRCDLVVLGHVHRVHDDRPARPRLIVLGGWHDRASYLRVDDCGVLLKEVADPDHAPGGSLARA